MPKEFRVEQRVSYLKEGEDDPMEGYITDVQRDKISIQLDIDQLGILAIIPISTAQNSVQIEGIDYPGPQSSDIFDEDEPVDEQAL